jgi:hypothetical protein
MTNRFTTLAAAAALFIGLTAPAAAGDDFVSLGSIGPWSLAADATVCRAEAAYKNGTSLDFFINSKGGAHMAVVHPNWNIPSGEYEVEVWVDRATATRFTAKATEGWVLWHFPLIERNVNLLSYGRTLYVKIGGQSYQYDLTRSKAMLEELARCAAARMTASNPFAGSPPPATAPASSNPFVRM